MCDANRATARGSRAGKQPLNLQIRNRNSDATDVDDRIDGTDFMKVNLFDGLSVNFGLGCAKATKHAERHVALAYC